MNLVTLIHKMTTEYSIKIENEEIIFAEVINSETLQIVMLCRGGNVYLAEPETNSRRLLCRLGLIDEEASAPLFKPVDKFTIESFQNYIGIVQSYGTKGAVINTSHPSYLKPLERGDYCANVSMFPIAFYAKNSQTFLIHGTDWNRLDITCLETGELLTERVVDYDTNKNYFDYFHSSLLVAPDSKSFTSNGWVWHPFGMITCYTVENFIKKFERSNIQIDFEPEAYLEMDWDRPLCWIDERTLAIGYNKQVGTETGKFFGEVIVQPINKNTPNSSENYQNADKKSFTSEIVFFDVKKVKVVKRIEFDGFAVAAEGDIDGKLFFEPDKRYFIGLNKRSGLLVSDFNGAEIYRDSTLTAHKYHPQQKKFYRFDYGHQLLEILAFD
jgi:hypothetical protein